MSHGVWAIKTTLNDHDPMSSLYAISFPVDQATDSFCTTMFASIDTIYGSTGINLDADVVHHIKKAYLYLVFLTKLEQVKKNSAYAAYKSDFARFLIDNKTAQPHIPDATLLKSAGWSAVVVTAQDLQASAVWQLYCKTSITDIFVYFVMVLEIVHNVEKQTFNYIPHFETSFYNADYTDFRTLNEMSRTRLVLEESLKNRFLQQCTSWNQLPSKSAGSKNKNSSSAILEHEIVVFRSSAFYKMIRNFNAIFGVDSSQQQSANNVQILASKALQSPLKEQVFAYYLFYEAIGQITGAMDDLNLLDVLNKCSTNALIPNIFPYKPQDYVLLDELLSIKGKVDGTSQNSAHASVQQYRVDELKSPEYLTQVHRNWDDDVKANLAKINSMQVQAQMWSFLKDLGHDFSKAWDDVKSGVEAGCKAVEHFTIAIGQGLAGIGAALVGQTSWAEKEFDLEKEQFKQSVTDLDTCVDDFASSLKDGIIAPFAELTGDLVGFIANDQKLGTDISTTMDQVADTLVNISATVAKDLASGPEEAVQMGLEELRFTATVADAAEQLFTGHVQGFLKAGKDLANQCIHAIVQAYSFFKAITLSTMKSLMTGLGVIVNAITTTFIDLVREITYVFTGGIFNMLHLGSIPAFKQAVAYSQEQANDVTTILQAHRSVMNQVFGVVACIAVDAVVDVGTGGAGTAADAEIDAGIEGGIETAEDGLNAAKEALATLGEDASAEAKEAAEQAVKNAEERVADVKSAAQEAKTAAEASKNAEQALTKAKQALKNAQTQLENATTEEAKEAAQTAVKQAESDLNEANTAARAARVAANAAKKEALQVAQQGIKKTIGQSVKDFFQDTAKNIQERVSNQIDRIKSLGQNFAKAVSNLPETAANVFRSSEDLAAETSLKLQAAERNLATLQRISANAEDIAKAQTEVDELTAANKEAQEIASESKLGTVKRLGRSALGKLGAALKPVGMIMNVTFNLGSMISGANQDAKNVYDLQNQSQALQKLWSFHNNNKISTGQQYLEYLDELEQKMQAEIGNQALMVTLSQNLENANILELRSAISSVLAPEYAEFLMPQPGTNLQMANIGTPWNLKTSYLDLYPTEGFFTATLGRLDYPFAQEIAQAPQVTNLVTGGQGSDKLWFNQRCSARDLKTDTGSLKKATDPLVVDIDMQFLYTLDSALYAGLYLGGNYHDYDSLNFVTPYLNNLTIRQAWALIAKQGQNPQQQPPYFSSPTNITSSIVDLDEAHLAKMVVLYRTQGSGTLMFGVYEHEGLGWILQTPLPTSAQLDQSHVYTFQVKLDQQQLQCKLFINNEIDPIINQTVAVTALANQRTYGMISSGAAIEWNQNEPKSEINVKLRQQPKAIETEIDRETNNKILLAQLNTPKFGAFELKPLSKQSMLLGQYVYACTQTDLKKIIKKDPIDFVIFGTNQVGAGIQFGMDPITAFKGSNPIIVSLVNGAMYDKQGTNLGVVANVLTEFQAQAGALPAKILEFITKEQASITQALSSITFGSFNLDIVSAAALNAGKYVYTSSQTLKDAQGVILLDATTKKPMIDYLVCANYENEALTIGMSPTASNANALYSFVSGNVYAKHAILTDGKPLIALDTQAIPAEQFGNWAFQYNLAPKDPLFVLINNAISAYGSAIPATAMVKNTKPLKINPVHHAQAKHFKGVHVALSGVRIGLGPKAPGIHVDLGKTKDFAARQKSAAGKTSFQLGKK